MKRLKFAAALLLGMAMSGPVSAGTIIFGGADTNNAYPFSTSQYTGEYQQLYDHSRFSGPVTITQIDFFSASPGGITGQYSIHLSTSSATLLTLSTDYTANIGADNSQFFLGSLSNTPTIIGTPFQYDPSLGDLLMDVQLLGPNLSSVGFKSGCTGDTSRVFNLGGNGAATVEPCSGLKTQITFADTKVPEPSALALFGAGLLGLLGLGVLQRRKSAAA